MEVEAEMREIKFRGKQINNGKWVYGYYVRHETRQICPIGDDKLKPEEIKHLIVVDSFADWNMPRQLQGIEVNPKTVGQYTSLKDENGVEIYEGDIYQCLDRGKLLPERLNMYVVEWANYYDGVHHQGFDVIQDGRGCEVIGNIHDNPELLEARQ